MQINGTVTIPHLLPFHRVKCYGWPGRGVQVPPRGGTANVGRGKATPSGRSSSKSMQVTHLEDGSVIVSATRRLPHAAQYSSHGASRHIRSREER